jgi:hypothetical protein
VCKACIAVECAEPAEVDQFYDELSRQGVPFVGPPRDHVWNARCAYFTDPDGTVWELYAWLEGGPGDYHVTSESQRSEGQRTQALEGGSNDIHA